MAKAETARLLRTIGANIQNRRRKLGLTQEQLAERIGCETSYLQKLEHGRASPSIEMLVRMSRALNVEIATFFRPAKPSPPKVGRPPKSGSKTTRSGKGRSRS